MYLSVLVRNCLCKQVGMCLTFCFRVKAVSCFSLVSSFLPFFFFPPQLEGIIVRVLAEPQHVMQMTSDK